MQFLKIFFLGMLLLDTVNCEIVLGQLPVKIVNDILSILFTGVVQLTGNCTNAKDGAPETNYWVYADNDTTISSIVQTPSAEICAGKTRIIFLTHGWSWDANAPYIIGLINAYKATSRYKDTCIISVNWGPYAMQDYQSAYCAAPEVANNVAEFMCALEATIGVALETFHLVGHSMGAQIFGIAGSLVQTNCNGKIGRITGLDPAGPLYTGIGTNGRLDPSDAIFVDVIHTNQGQYGYTGSCGHVDAFPNCGYFQPGCLSKVFNNIQNVTQLLNFPLDYISCNHRRSCDYFQESIMSDNFIAKPCTICGLPICSTLPMLSERKVIGENCTSPGANINKNYLLCTNSNPPYARGNNVPLLECT